MGPPAAGPLEEGRGDAEPGRNLESAPPPPPAARLRFPVPILHLSKEHYHHAASRG